MLDWDDLRSFLAIARHGNLSAAARSLKVTQTTMGRRLDALHASAGARLLQKTPRGFVLTAAGERVLANVERMEAEAFSVERAISGEDATITGEVRITTVETFGARVLVPLLKTLAEKQPALSVELITDTRALSLSRREADIALRLAQFEQHEVVVRRVGEMGFGIYASQTYLAARGIPDFKAGAVDHAVVTLQDDLALLPEARQLTDLTRAARIVMRANSRDAHLQAALSGYAIVSLPCYLADAHADLVELQIPGDRVSRGIWLGVHQDTRHIPKLRLTIEHITEGLRAQADHLSGRVR
jgi:DNA-binding transcriptional LysR family regulator